MNSILLQKSPYSLTASLLFKYPKSKISSEIQGKLLIVTPWTINKQKNKKETSRQKKKPNKSNYIVPTNNGTGATLWFQRGGKVI